MPRGVDAHERLFRRLEQAVDDREVPGCVALVWRRGGVAYHEAHGVLATHPASPVLRVPVARDTIYDLASLTKVLCTTTLAARFVASGRLALDSALPVALRPRCGDDTRLAPTLLQLLEHCAGLEAHREFFREARSRDAVIAAVLATPPASEPGRAVVYSDLGFVLLGAWLEAVGGDELDALFERWIARPLGVDVDRALAFRRVSESGIDGRELTRVAPTEVYDPALHDGPPPSWFAVRRRSHAHGEVHDDNAYCMGGVAGHAGLFGHAEAILQVARAWAEGGPLGLPTALRRRFFARSPVEGSTRRLGWDAPDPRGEGSTANALSERAAGHLGFTGTSLWIDGIDPSAEGRGGADDGASIYVLLANRVHPTRQNERIRRLRQDFHGLAAQL